jgi:hypothetical protein
MKSVRDIVAKLRTYEIDKDILTNKGLSTSLSDVAIETLYWVLED